MHNSNYTSLCIYLQSCPRPFFCFEEKEDNYNNNKKKKNSLGKRCKLTSFGHEGISRLRHLFAHSNTMKAVSLVIKVFGWKEAFLNFLFMINVQFKRTISLQQALQKPSVRL